MTYKIKVPATSANLGPGFDSMGIALDLFLEVEVLETSEKWHVIHDFGNNIPTDETNLIVKAALFADADLLPHKLIVKSQIPLARGLGSSSAAIVAGLLIAKTSGLHNWTDKQLLDMATQIEGHPDNVAPAIFGDLTISTMINQKAISVKCDFPQSDFIAYIPDYELPTKKSRSVLPEMLPFKTAVQAGSITNVLIAALDNNNLKTASTLFEADLYHEPYREPLVPELSQLRTIAHSVGAYATYLSGAGPTVMTILPKNVTSNYLAVTGLMPFSGKFIKLNIIKNGASVEKI